MKGSGEKGNVVIEASIVVTIAIAMVMALISLGFIVHSRSLMDTVAQEAAVNIANVYASEFKDPVYGYIDGSEFYKTDLYRYFDGFLSSGHNEPVKKKAEWYSLYRLKKGSLAKIESPKVTCEIERKPDSVIRHQIVVRIEAKFEIPFAAIWGGTAKTTYVAQGRAETVDLLDYFNTVGMVNETVVAKLDKLLSTLTKVIKFFD